MIIFSFGVNHFECLQILVYFLLCSFVGTWKYAYLFGLLDSPINKQFCFHNWIIVLLYNIQRLITLWAFDKKPSSLSIMVVMKTEIMKFLDFCNIIIIKVSNNLFKLKWKSTPHDVMNESLSYVKGIFKKIWKLIESFFFRWCSLDHHQQHKHFTGVHTGLPKWKLSLYLACWRPNIFCSGW